jgi:hypothetical protein
METNEQSDKQPSERLLRLLAVLQDGKGQFISVTFGKEETPNAASKKAGVKLRKQTTMVVRTGVEFQNLSVVKKAIEAGERGEVQSLPWGKWLIYPYAIENNGKEYIRLTLGANNRPTCIYWVNEVEVSREEFIQHLPPSKRVSRETEVLSVCIDNISRLG